MPWEPATGGSNIPAINDFLLPAFGMALGGTVIDGVIDLPGGKVGIPLCLPYLTRISGDTCPLGSRTLARRPCPLCRPFFLRESCLLHARALGRLRMSRPPCHGLLFSEYPVVAIHGLVRRSRPSYNVRFSSGDAVSCFFLHGQCFGASCPLHAHFMEIVSHVSRMFVLFGDIFKTVVDPTAVYVPEPKAGRVHALSAFGCADRTPSFTLRVPDHPKALSSWVF